jgi:hypothetical protein
MSRTHLDRMKFAGASFKSAFAKSDIFTQRILDVGLRTALHFPKFSLKKPSVRSSAVAAAAAS